MIAPLSRTGTGRIAHGVHPEEHKELARQSPIEILPAPASIVLALLQHTGAPCEAVVKTRDAVEAGQLIGDSKAFISAPVHTPVAGVVQRESVATLPNGRHVKTIPIQTATGQPESEALRQDQFGGDWTSGTLEDRGPEEIAGAVRAAGIVGQGGAAFPAHVKLTRNPAKPVDTLLLNGCECEPYLTADDRLMVESPAQILAGARLAARAAGANRVCIAIEDNKPEALKALREAAGGIAEILVLQSRYPMGGEKQTVRAALGRTIPTGGLPLDVGVVMLNVASAAAIARAVLRGKPLTHRVVSVTGEGIVRPRNVLAPIGASYADLVAFCGGLKPEAVRVIAGGPMMGFALATLDVPITKGTSGIVALTAKQTRRAAETSCVRCGRCVDVCPLNLIPSRLALATRQKNWDLARRHHLAACMECGCCAYVCPASLPLVQLIRTGKVQMMKETAKKS
ncbi:MAG: electron transport complex subunit RsxC [Kiritimatiellia bacterium]|nr:electron transport complex subunit RsxC [Kiritimatiellia bacterium]